MPRVDGRRREHTRSKWTMPRMGTDKIKFESWAGHGNVERSNPIRGVAVKEFGIINNLKR